MLALALKPIDLTFQEKGHVHLLRGIPVPGCTSISSLFQDDGWKFRWPVKIACEYIYDELMAWKKGERLGMSFKEMIKTAKNLWLASRDGSAAKGTSAHQYIHDWISAGIAIPPTVGDEIRNCYNEFRAWERKFNPVWVASELQVGSESNNFAGILDALCTIDDNLILLDFKTGDKVKLIDWNTKKEYVKPDYVVQLAGLHICLEEMGVKPDKRAILHLPKAGPYEYVPVESDLEFEKRCFLAGLSMYPLKNMLVPKLLAA